MRVVLLVMVSALVMMVGCGSDDETPLPGDETECSGHGHLHGDHCHCDEGYEVDPDDAELCIAE